MLELLTVMLRAWYFELRKNVPAAMSARINKRIRQAMETDLKVVDIVEKAKKWAAAQSRRNTTLQLKSALKRSTAAARHVEHVPCKKVRK